jgi:error-prone DNA polymerase
MGLNYAKGLRDNWRKPSWSPARAGLFRTAEDLAIRVPALNQKELTLLSHIGALNKLEGIARRRDALWQVERAGKAEGPLLRQNLDSLHDDSETLPLCQMNTEERIIADYAGTGLTIGKHPLHYRRPQLQRDGILSASDLRNCKNGEYVRHAGCVIARQRPGTAKGFIFLSMEDETGIANVIITPDLFERERLLITRSKFILVEGALQNQDGVIHIKAQRLRTLSGDALEVHSHDFH